MRIFSRTRSGLLSALVAIAVLAPDWASAAADRADIGGVDLVRIWASGTPPETGKRDLFVADRVFGNEVVETVRDGALHLRFIDDTEFKLGSDSRATLDTFLYDPASNAGELTLSLKEGLFRLKTGRIKKEGVLLVTPVALIEVRGTDLTIEVLPDGTTRVSVTEGEAMMRSKADGSERVLTPGGDGGQIVPGGSVEAYAGNVGAGDSGILAGAAFETDPTFQITNSGSNEDLTEVTYQSASAGQTLSALSPLAVFDDSTQTALQTTVTGVGLLAAAEGTTQVAAIYPTILTDGTIVNSVTGAVTNTQLAVGIGGTGGNVGTVLASVNSSTFVDALLLGTGFNGMTGFETVTLDVSQFVGAGSLTLGFQVFDQGDFTVDSAVLLDNLAFLPNGNGGFETGDFTGYVTSGEVTIISSLGQLTPTEGEFMAFFSTGGTAVDMTTSTITTEPFVLADGVDSISFEFNFLSNEYPDFVGSTFDDTLTVTIDGTSQLELVEAP